MLKKGLEKIKNLSIKKKVAVVMATVLGVGGGFAIQKAVKNLSEQESITSSTIEEYTSSNITSSDVYNNMIEDDKEQNTIYGPIINEIEIIGDEEDNKVEANETIEKVEIDFYDTIDLSDYKGDLLMQGLTNGGYDASYAFRSELAKHYGINDYVGTIEQNIKLLEILKQEKNIPDNAVIIMPDGTKVEIGTPSVGSIEDEKVNTLKPSTPSNNNNNTNNNQNNNLVNNNNQNTNISKPSTPVKDENKKPNKPVIDNSNNKEENNNNSNTGSDNNNNDNNNSYEDAHKHQYKTVKTYYVNNGDTHTYVVEKECSCGKIEKEEITNPHSHNTWKALNDELEQSTCACGAVKQQKHNYRNDSTIYVINEDGTHTKTTVETCPNCNHTKKTEVTDSHKFNDWHQVGDKQHQHECECQEVEVKNHNFDKTLTTVTYENKEGATHTKVVTDTCKDCNHKVVTKTTVNHTMSEWVSVDDTKEQRTCECGRVEERKHEWLTDWTYNKETGKEERICGNCNHKVEREHTNHKFSEWNHIGNNHYNERTCQDCETKETVELDHNWTAWAKYDDNNEARTCTYDNCKVQMETKSHAWLTDWTYNKETGKEEKTCGNDYCNHKVEKDHTEHKFSEWNHVGNNHYNERTCEICETVEKEELPCNFSDWEKVDDTQESRHCTYDGCDKTEAQDHPYVVESYDEDDINGKEHKVCPNCDNHVDGDHTLKTTKNDDYSITYECLNDGCDFTYTIEHVHTTTGSKLPFSIGKRDVCHYTAYVCDGCEDHYDKVYDYDHDMKFVKDNGSKTKYKCYDCDYTYIKDNETGEIIQEIEQEVSQEKTLVLSLFR